MKLAMKSNGFTGRKGNKYHASIQTAYGHPHATIILRDRSLGAEFNIFQRGFAQQFAHKENNALGLATEH